MIRGAGVVLTLALAATTTAVAVARSHHGQGTAAGSPTAYADGAPPGFSGGFGEQSCHACHFFNDPTENSERVAIRGVPDRFVAGESYPLTISLSRQGMKVAGFQFTARFEDDGAQAGNLSVGPDSTESVKVETHDAVQYANQQKGGSTPAEAQTARWSIVWTAPDAARSVVFHVAANAGDGDGTAEGDFVETAMVVTRP